MKSTPRSRTFTGLAKTAPSKPFAKTEVPTGGFMAHSEPWKFGGGGGRAKKLYT